MGKTNNSIFYSLTIYQPHKSRLPKRTTISAVKCYSALTLISNHQFLRQPQYISRVLYKVQDAVLSRDNLLERLQISILYKERNIQLSPQFYS